MRKVEAVGVRQGVINRALKAETLNIPRES